MTMLAPGIEFQTVEPNRGDAYALRPDIVGFAGVFARGPVLVPRVVEDWGHTTRLFGGFFQLLGRSRRQAFGPLALYGFQQNGGATAVVMRLASPSMCAARAVLPDPATGTCIGLAASSPGAWANPSSAADPVRLRMAIRLRGRTPAPTFPIVAGTLVDGSIVRVRASDGGVAFGTLRKAGSGLSLVPPTAHPGPYVIEELEPQVDVTVEAGTLSERFLGLSLDPDDEQYVWSVLAPPARPGPDWAPFVPDAWRPLKPALSLALAQQGPGASDFVRATTLGTLWSNAAATSDPWLPPSAETTSSVATSEIVATLDQGVDNVKDIDIASYRAAIGALSQHPYPSILAIPDLMLSAVPDPGCQRPLDLTTIPLPVPPPSNACAPPPPKAPPPKTPPLPPAEVLVPDDIPQLSENIAMLQAELVTAVSTSDTPADRIVLLDPFPGRAPAMVIQDVSGLAADVPRPELGALFYPWLQVLDPLAPTTNILLVPPSGHVAGVMAKTTRARGSGAPFANVAVAGAVAAERLLDVDTRGRLNSGQVSALREITGRGVLVFGERTLDADDATVCFVPPSRVLAYIRRVLRVTGETLVFEPNDAFLSLRIVVTLDAILKQLFLGGAFAGDTPAQSYRVRCDDVTTPPDERALGRIIALVDVAPAVPLEFITLRIAFSRDGAAVLDDVPTGTV